MYLHHFAKKYSSDIHGTGLYAFGDILSGEVIWDITYPLTNIIDAIQTWYSIAAKTPREDLFRSWERNHIEHIRKLSHVEPLDHYLHNVSRIVQKPSSSGIVSLREAAYASLDRRDILRKICHFGFQLPDRAGDKYFFSYSRLTGEPLDDSFYQNHSCDPNTIWLGPATTIASRNIKAGEELTYDYRTTDRDSVDTLLGIAEPPAVIVPNCLCGSAECQKKVIAYL